MLFIGICGASGSGKSTLAEDLCARLGKRCIMLQQDAYYKDNKHLPFEERCKVNYDEPSSFDHDLLLSDIRSLINGQPITRKCYDYANHCRADHLDEMIEPHDVVILEGIHCFHDKRLLDEMFLKIYLSVEPDVCLLRRIQRDITERGRDIDGIALQYTTTVKPMYEQYIRNYVHDADIIVAKGGKNARISDVLVSYVNDALGNDFPIPQE